MGDKKKKFHLTSLQITWGATAFLTSICCILFSLFLINLPAMQEVAGKIVSAVMPAVMGGAMAYLLLPLYNGICRRLIPRLEKSMEPLAARRLGKLISTVLSVLTLLSVVTVMMVMAVPQVIDSITSLVASMPATVNRLEEFLNDMLRDHPEFSDQLILGINSVESNMNDMVTTYVTPSLQSIVTNITQSVIGFVKMLFNLIIGVIVCVYLLNIKETFSAQGKKLIYSMMKPEHANVVVEDVHEIHKIFSGFISGKIIDSLIIGAITFVVLTLVKMPYATMISVIVGITNVIPFFGPFIGAVPSFVIILTVSPIKSLYFIIYIIIIQTIDGNILGPKILGDSTGLPSIWVLFSILLFGGLFGFIGMVLGVPVMATIYFFVSRVVNRKLESKGLGGDSMDYFKPGVMVDPNGEPLAEMFVSAEAGTEADAGDEERDAGDGEETVPENED
ncbi:MAG: AI-2E family transporter [Clostridia bacterium]|nr:AI-2E family transporter [Clostridia bacterium]